MTPEEKLIAELGSENWTLKSRIEILEHRIANLLGREENVDMLGMTRTEFRLAHLLAFASPKVVKREALLEARRPDTQYVADGVHIKIVDVLISKIRKHFARHGLKIQTSWGVGYWMTEDDAERFTHLITRNFATEQEEAA